MWMLHKTIIKYCGNQVYILLFNSFDDFFHQIATFYYQSPENRKAARELWGDLTEASKNIDGEAGANQMLQFLSTTYSKWDADMFEKYQNEMVNVEKNPENDVEESEIEKNDNNQ
jgi:DNA-binding FadR family transcriptional regulator